MKLHRRQLLTSLVAAPAVLTLSRSGAAQGATTLRISHQFPGGTIDQGDFRDRLVRIFSREVEKRTNGSLKFEVYANSSLMKTHAQFSALRKGALDMSLYPIAYAGGEVHACNIGLMPCLVSSYEQGARWKTSDIGKTFSNIVEAKGVKFISWIWQAGGVVSRKTPGVLSPKDVEGVRIRGGSREMDLMFTAAGGLISTMPSNEVYIGMQTGSLDAAATSSTSLISFRLEELAKSLTAARRGSFWFMLEPLLMSKAIYESLKPEQQKAIMEVGGEMEAWAMAEAKKDDEAVARIYQAKGVTVSDFSHDELADWRRVAERSAWKDFAAKSTEAAELLKLAQTVV